MTYTFIIERRTGFWIVVGLLVVMVLCFLGGVGVGVQLDVPQSQSLAATETTDTAPLRPEDSLGTDVSVLAERAPLSDDAQGPGRSSGPDTASASASGSSRASEDVDASSATTPERPETSPATSTPASSPPPASPQSSSSASPSASASESDAIRGPYTIQLGLFSERENARQMASSAREAGHTVVVRRLVKNASPMYRVWAGEFESSAAALRAVDTFRAYASGAFVARTNAR